MNCQGAAVILHWLYKISSRLVRIFSSMSTEFHREGERADSDSGEENQKKVEKRPEDCIPDLPENAAARNFLKNAPTKGLWLPMGQEVKVMQCYRCKAYGHRTGDRECPLFQQGNVLLDSQRQAREDPMSSFVARKSESRRDELERVSHLRRIVTEIRDIEKSRRKQGASSTSSHRKSKKKRR